MKILLSIKAFMMSLTWDKLVGFLIAFIAPIISFLIFTGILIVLDSLTGVWAAKNRKEPRTSRAMAKGIFPKLLLYPIILVASYIAELMWDGVPFVSCAAGMIAVVEWYSILENITDILGFNPWKRFINKIVKLKEDVNKIKE